ncbi:predicted protein [Histoplasma capsulatum G186AR]|uniref:Uncharacterized protein n=1 Tax=Ajellomyces capsulatus (strain G186AR / H82 / ATCC MYA-2454 / RMSCC 2432) TaxID=447093 RepID=C0NQK1_AJECG|nr:uncharacterized protein HCBG_05789 [Histoplasma capsulatum G186AR]EEH06473.1 predicted protein [Histoplasma capsulatum G186AR]
MLKLGLRLQGAEVSLYIFTLYTPYHETAPKLGNTPNHRHALVNWSDSAGVALDIPRPIPESLARQGVCGFQVSYSSAEEPGCGFATKRSYLIAHFTSSSTPAQNDKWCACTYVSGV